MIFSPIQKKIFIFLAIFIAANIIIFVNGGNSEELKEIFKLKKQLLKYIKKEKQDKENESEYTPQVYVIGYSRPIEYESCYSIASALINNYSTIIMSGKEYDSNKSVLWDLENSRKTDSYKRVCENYKFKEKDLLIFSDIHDTGKI